MCEQLGLFLLYHLKAGLFHLSKSRICDERVLKASYLSASLFPEHPAVASFTFKFSQFNAHPVLVICDHKAKLPDLFKHLLYLLFEPAVSAAFEYLLKNGKETLHPV